MSCLIVFLSICLPWGNFKIDVSSNEIARVASIARPGLEVEIWAGSDNEEWNDWPHAPRLCLRGGCIAYRREDKRTGEGVQTTLWFCSARAPVPQRLIVRAESAEKRDQALSLLMVLPTGRVTGQGVSLAHFDDVRPVPIDRGALMRRTQNGRCPV